MAGNGTVPLPPEIIDSLVYQPRRVIDIFDPETGAHVGVLLAVELFEKLLEESKMVSIPVPEGEDPIAPRS